MLKSFARLTKFISENGKGVWCMWCTYGGRCVLEWGQEQSDRKIIEKESESACFQVSPGPGTLATTTKEECASIK